MDLLWHLQLQWQPPPAQLLWLQMGSLLVQEYLPMVTAEQRQMVYLLDQMSVPMDLLWHLQLQWQPPPAQLLWLQMGSLLALESLQMGTVEQHQMVSRLDLM